jgi:hypothetical protein
MLDAGEITPETMFRRGGMVEWRPLRTIIIAEPLETETSGGGLANGKRYTENDGK